MVGAEPNSRPAWTEYALVPLSAGLEIHNVQQQKAAGGGMYTAAAQEAS